MLLRRWEALLETFAIHEINNWSILTGIGQSLHKRRG
jgi:hypothetical protein